MKKSFQLFSLLLLLSLISSCSKEVSDGPLSQPNLEKVIGKYQLPPEESIRRNEKRLWTVTKADDNHVRVKEDLTTELDSENPKVISHVFNNVTVKDYESGTIFLDFNGSKLEDPEFTINGHKNFLLFGYGGVQPNAIHATLHAKDLSSEEVIPFSKGFLELVKLE